MGFLPGMLDKSVFNQDTWAAAIGDDDSNGYAVVRVKPNNARLFGDGKPDPDIKGVFDFESGGFSFNIDANWEEFGRIGGIALPTASSKVSDITGRINAAVNTFGVSDIGAGLSSQLIYQKSGFLQITIPMMVVDWNGTGQPLLTAKLLSRYCLPSNSTNIEEKIKEEVKRIEEELKKASQEEKGAKQLAAKGVLSLSEGVKNFGQVVQNQTNQILDNTGITGEAVKAAGEAASNAAEVLDRNVGGISDLYTLRASPSDVTVEIGQFFKNKNMVITGVDFSFSKQMTKRGPLFVNINISLKSRRILTSLEDIGLVVPNQDPRYVEQLSDGTNATGL